MQTETIDLNSLRLFYNPPGTLRMTVGNECSYPTVKLHQAWPLSAPKRFLSFLNAKGEEILLVERLEDLPENCRPVAEEELRRRYLTARVTGVDAIRAEFGVTYWNVRTDKGPRDFVLQSLTEACTWLGDGHLLVTDVDGNRFEFENIAALDEESRGKLDWIL